MINMQTIICPFCGVEHEYKGVSETHCTCGKYFYGTPDTVLKELKEHTRDAVYMAVDPYHS
jgi:sarcosine oxidase delta subunit